MGSCGVEDVQANMNWYRKAQEDIMGDIMKEFLVEDSSQKFLAPSDRSSEHVAVSMGMLKDAFSTFGFMIAGYRESLDDMSICVLVKPSKDFQKPSSYHQTVKTRKDLEGFDQEKGARLVDFLKKMPGVYKVSVAPDSAGVGWIWFEIFFVSKVHFKSSNSKTRTVTAQDDMLEDILLEYGGKGLIDRPKATVSRKAIMEMCEMFGLECFRVDSTPEQNGFIIRLVVSEEIDFETKMMKLKDHICDIPGMHGARCDYRSGSIECWPAAGGPNTIPSRRTWKVAQEKDLVEEIMEETFDTSMLTDPTGIKEGLKLPDTKAMSRLLKNHGLKLLGMVNHNGEIVLDMSFGGDNKAYHEALESLSGAIMSSPVVKGVWTETLKGRMHISFK
jgi:hypothetical protein